MLQPVQKLLSTMKLGKPQTRSGMTAIPLWGPSADGPDYLSLREALDQGKLQITEIAESGSVPELKVVNGYNRPVLLLDGEELIGAKQNRVLNSTVLLKELSTTTIPVSCTEQGRWSYSSPEFSDAGVLMSPHLRHEKNRSVSDSLRTNQGHRSDQGRIWREIDALSRREGVHSPTGAMHDVFAARRKTLNRLQKSFTCSDGQMGLIVLFAGKPVGCDYLSSPKVFAALFPKLIQSYAMDALAISHNGRITGAVKTAQTFLNQAATLAHTEHPAVSYGSDIRFFGETLVGSALVLKDLVIHTAFFAEQKGELHQSMAGSSRRRRFRQS